MLGLVFLSLIGYNCVRMRVRICVCWLWLPGCCDESLCLVAIDLDTMGWVGRQWGGWRVRVRKLLLWKSRCDGMDWGSRGRTGSMSVTVAVKKKRGGLVRGGSRCDRKWFEAGLREKSTFLWEKWLSLILGFLGNTSGRRMANKGPIPMEKSFSLSSSHKESDAVLYLGDSRCIEKMLYIYHSSKSLSEKILVNINNVCIPK